MNPIIEIVDDCFIHPESLLNEIIALGFKDIVNPADGITYPAICELNGIIKDRVTKLISRTMSSDIKPNYCFARKMSVGHGSPNTIHEDSIMGKYSALIYMSHQWNHRQGTQFYNFLGNNDQDPNNIYPVYSPTVFMQGAFNRMVIHETKYWHAAIPMEGFGNHPDNSRIVITCFFDIVQ